MQKLGGLDALVNLRVSRTLCDGQVKAAGLVYVDRYHEGKFSAGSIVFSVGKRVVSSDVQGETITLEASSTVRAGPCPARHSRSHRLHGRYVRKLEERPRFDQRVVLATKVRRFKCMNANCPRRTFAENIHTLAGRYQRRT